MVTVMFISNRLALLLLCITGVTISAGVVTSPDDPAVGNTREARDESNSISNNNNDNSNLIIMSGASRCLARGGVCTLSDGCPTGERHGDNDHGSSSPSSADLCSNARDVVCCRKLPTTPGVCSSRGGECVLPSVCHRGPTDSRGTCEAGLVCCIWV